MGIMHQHSSSTRHIADTVVRPFQLESSTSTVKHSERDHLTRVLMLKHRKLINKFKRTLYARTHMNMCVQEFHKMDSSNSNSNRRLAPDTTKALFNRSQFPMSIKNRNFYDHSQFTF